MINKILMGIAITAIVGGLIFGGVNRTLAQTTDNEPVAELLRQEKEINNQGSLDKDPELRKQGVGIVNGGAGQGLGFGNLNNGSKGTGNGNGSTNDAYGQSGDGLPAGDGVPDADAEACITLTGTQTARAATLR